MIKFKIRDTVTGLYSHGGYTPTWSSRGKSWDTIGSVTSHLKMYLKGYSPNPKWNKRGKTIPTSWEVVAFQVNLVEINNTPIISLLGAEVHPITKKKSLKKKLNIKKKTKK